jgi:hypothetical protein
MPHNNIHCNLPSLRPPVSMSVVQDLSARGLGAHETNVGDLGVQEVDMIMDMNEMGVHVADVLTVVHNNLLYCS